MRPRPDDDFGKEHGCERAVVPDDLPLPPGAGALGGPAAGGGSPVESLGRPASGRPGGGPPPARSGERVRPQPPGTAPGAGPQAGAFRCGELRCLRHPPPSGRGPAGGGVLLCGGQAGLSGLPPPAGGGGTPGTGEEEPGPRRRGGDPFGNLAGARADDRPAPGGGHGCRTGGGGRPLPGQPLFPAGGGGAAPHGKGAGAPL